MFGSSFTVSFLGESTSNRSAKILNLSSNSSFVGATKLISNVINFAHDENNYSNPVKVDVYTALEIMYAYTNINFTDKQKEDVTKLYDLIVSSGLYTKVLEAIPDNEYCNLLNAIKKSIDAIYAYQNSVMGILDTISTDYSNLDLDASEIQKKIGDPENMELLRSVLAKLG